MKQLSRSFVAMDYVEGEPLSPTLGSSQNVNSA